MPVSGIVALTAAVVGLLVLALLAAPWARLAKRPALDVFAGTLVALLAVWQMRTQVAPDLPLHLLGATVLTLIAGPWLAWLGIALVATLSLLFGIAQAPFSGHGWGLALLGGGAVPVAVSWLCARALRRFAPTHPFVYIFGNGFFGAGLAVFAGGLATAALASFAARHDSALLLEVWLPAVLLLAFAEAWLSGMIVTLLVIYRPQWLSTFDDRRYLAAANDRDGTRH